MWYVTCGGYVLTNAILVPKSNENKIFNKWKKKKMYKIIIIIIHILGIL